MSGFLAALKADLLDRRLRAFLLVLGAALIAALAYAVLGGGGSTPAETTAAVSPGAVSGTGSVTPVTSTTNPNQALAETPGGASKQHGGSTRDPFKPLPGTFTTPPAAKAGAGSKGSKGTSTKGATEVSKPVAPAPKKKTTQPKTTYDVSVDMGLVPVGTPPQSVQLTPYDHLKAHEKLPSKKLSLLAFEGVSKDGKKAKFKIVGEAIPRAGQAVCSPSPSQCLVLDLQVGQTQELEYLAPSGPPVVYELKVASLTAGKR
jgi:hypothetical protein